MRSLFAVALVLFIVPASRAADDENPFKKVKVGEWADYKMVTTVMGNNITGKVRMKITAKDDANATLEITGKATLMGMELDVPAQKQTIELGKPFDPTSNPSFPKGTDVKTERSGKETEKIKVNGKEYDASWIKSKWSANNVPYEVKVWLSKDAPLSGMVKMEMTSTAINMTMELTGSGSK